MLWELGELLQGWSGEASIQARILAKTAALLDAAAKLPLSDNKDLKATLERIAAAAPELVGNPRYVRLLEISMKAGI